MTETTKTADTLRSKATETKDDHVDLGHRAKEATQDKLHDLADSASQTYGAGKEKLQAFGAYLGDKVQGAPSKALLIAAGVGLLLGILVRRS